MVVNDLFLSSRSVIFTTCTQTHRNKETGQGASGLWTVNRTDINRANRGDVYTSCEIAECKLAHTQELIIGFVISVSF